MCCALKKMATSGSREGVVRDDKTGELFLPATQRPDGSWRKPRKVKEGYVPQEEVPTYENRGVSWMKSISTLPPGMAPAEDQEVKTNKSKNAKKRQKRKGKKQQENETGPADDVAIVANVMEKTSISKPPTTAPKSNLTQEDIQKKLRASKKKLKEIDNLQAKIDSGEIENPEQNQVEKLTKREFYESEIEEYESLLA